MEDGFVGSPKSVITTREKRIMYRFMTPKMQKVSKKLINKLDKGPKHMDATAVKLDSHLSLRRVSKYNEQVNNIVAITQSWITNPVLNPAVVYA